jgi:hypothetical protein
MRGLARVHKSCYWPTSPDGTGTALQRISTKLIGNTADNWAGAIPTRGAHTIEAATNGV